MLKATADDEGVRKIQELLSLVWDSEQYPEKWKRGTIIELPKVGNLTDCNTWKGITLLSVPGKVMVMNILERICETLDRKLREGQTGFRAGTVCSDHIFVLINQIEHSEEGGGGKLVVNFIDFRYAFDSLHRTV